MKEIVTIPDKKLYQVTAKVTSFDEKLAEQTKTMRKVLKKYEGAGLAANQLGYNNRVIVVELADEESKNSIPFQVFVNPEIVQAYPEKDILEEGCLSLPKIELRVERSKKIKVRAQNIDGKKNRLTANDILARILQHEVDHLNGIIFTQRTKEKYFHDFPILKKIKIVFIGSGNFAVPILEGLILLGFRPLIMTEKAKIAGRNKLSKQTAVAVVAQKFNLKYFEVENFSQFKFPRINFDLLICADFGQKIPENILKMPKIAPLNIHPSLLPKYRGPSPIQNTILNGDQITGVTIIKMTKDFDAGSILAQVETKVLKDDDSLTLENRLATLGLKLLFEALPKIANHELEEISQEDLKKSITTKFKKTDGEINWQASPESIERQIRAFKPWPGSYTFIGNVRLIIHQAHLENNTLVPDVVQKEGGKAMSWQEFLRGYRGPKPSWLKKIKVDS